MFVPASFVSLSLTEEHRSQKRSDRNKRSENKTWNSVKRFILKLNLCFLLSNLMFDKRCHADFKNWSGKKAGLIVTQALNNLQYFHNDRKLLTKAIINN